jgi:hypothetical protein
MAVLTAAILLALFLGGGKSASKAERYLAGLRAQGEKVTFQELPGTEQAGTNAAYAAVLAVRSGLGGIGFSPGGMNYGIQPEPGRCEVSWKQPVVGAVSGRTLAWEDLRAYVEQAESVLEPLRSALRTAPPQWGKRTNYLQQPVADFVAIRNCAQWLGAATLSALHEGELERALENQEALTALARANAEDYTLVSVMIRVAVAGLGLETTWQALQAEGWSEARLERLQRAWETVDLLDALETGYVGERAGGVDLWTEARRSSGRQMRRRLGMVVGTNTTLQTLFTDLVIYPAYKATSMDADELFYLESMGRAISEIRGLRQGRPWDASTNMAWHSNRLHHLPKRFMLSARAFPNYVKATQTALRRETSRRLTITAIAIRRYQQRHPSPPPELGALCPEYLPRPPLDPMNGLPFRYRVGTNDSFVLYSVGEDLRDNGGDPAPSAGGKPGFDIPRDIVWPRPAD